jgi:activator of HSP90 ATPase
MATAAPARMSRKVGGKYSVYNGYITGKNLHLVKDKLIVQTWRGQDWEESDLDSTFILSIEQKGKDVVLQVVHANVPDKQVKSIDKDGARSIGNHGRNICRENRFSNL